MPDDETAEESKLFPQDPLLKETLLAISRGSTPRHACWLSGYTSEEFEDFLKENPDQARRVQLAEQKFKSDFELAFVEYAKKSPTGAALVLESKHKYNRKAGQMEAEAIQSSEWDEEELDIPNWEGESDA